MTSLENRVPPDNLENAKADAPPKPSPSASSNDDSSSTPNASPCQQVVREGSHSAWGITSLRTFSRAHLNDEPLARSSRSWGSGAGPADATIELTPVSSFPGERVDFEVEVPAAPKEVATGRYILGAEIGRGGVGTVHAAWDVHLDREVALKVLRQEHQNRPEIALRFLKEARITSRLQHPGVVAIYEVGTSPDELPFFVMQLIHGKTLDQILNSRSDLITDRTRLLDIFFQVCQVVAYAHSQGVIHRDLKPANIMAGAFGLVKVTDWGLAKLLNEPEPLEEFIASSHFNPYEGMTADSRLDAADLSWNETQLGTIFGTPAYIPPEQALGETQQVDKRADVFGLGSLLCEIFTGAPPYTGASGREIYNKASAADTDDAFRRLDASAAPQDLLTLTKACLARDRDARPVDALQVLQVISSYLHSDQRRAQQDLIRFFDLSLDLFCIASINGFFLRVNCNFMRILGYSVAELTSRPFVEFVHPDDREPTIAECSHLENGVPTVRFLNRYRHSDGHYLWLEWNAQAVPEERTIHAVARDVTDRVTLAEAQRRAEVCAGRSVSSQRKCRKLRRRVSPLRSLASRTADTTSCPAGRRHKLQSRPRMRCQR